MTVRIGIVGRPNVGKSTLFNGMIGKSQALVSNISGVTRDYREEKISINGFDINLIDTAGMSTKVVSDQEKRLIVYTEKIVKKLDLVLFVLDGRQGLTVEDESLFTKYRKLNKPIILVINKVENKRIEESASYESYKLGNKDQLFVSAEHRIGLLNIKDKISEILMKLNLKGADHEESDEKNDIRSIAVIGRPNVGKSTLINAIINKERFITGPESGLTRDSNHVIFKWFGDYFKIHDTAGARRKSKIIDSLERDSVKRTINAINFSEVVVLVLDVNDLLNTQDLKIASLCEKEGRALILAINKVDEVKSGKGQAKKKLSLKLEKSLPQLKGAFIEEVSGLKKMGLKNLKNCILEAYRNWNFEISTSGLNSWMAEKQEKHTPPINKEKRRIRLKYIVQTKSRPPTITIFTSHNATIPSSYKKYLLNALREDFNLYSTPIRIIFKSGSNPYSSN